MSARQPVSKGSQQVVRVEHVTVQAGGQAIVGNVSQGGGGGHQQSEDRPHALAHTPEPQMRCPDPRRQPAPVAGSEAQAAVPDARRRQRQRCAGRNRNALKHGCYSHEVLEFRRAMRQLLREAHELIEIT